MVTLLDTSFLIAYHNKQDDHHQRAQEIEPGNPAINDYIYNEVLNILSLRQSHKKAVEYGKFLREAVNILRVSEPVFDNAVQKFEKHEVSFTDASLAATADLLNIDKVASFDTDFDQLPGVKRVH